MGKDSSRRKSCTWPWLIFLMYLLLLMPLLGSETLAWKHSCVERTDHHSGEKTACPATPSGSFSIHHPSATSPRSTNKGLTGASCALRAPGHRVAVPLHPLPQRAAPDSARCSLTHSGCSWWPSKALEQIQMGPRGPEKAQYPEWEYQASEWPSVSGWMTVRMTTFYHYFYVSPALHSCLNTQKNDSIWRFCCAQGLNNPSPGMVPNWSFFSTWYLSKGFGWALWPPVCSHDGHQISYPKTLKSYTCPLPQNPHLSNILVMIQFTSAGWTGQMILSSNQPSFELEKLRQNAQNINFHVTGKKIILKGIIQEFFFKRLCRHHLYLVSLLSTQQSNRVPFAASPSSSLSQPLTTTYLLPISVNLSILNISHKCCHTICDLLCLASFISQGF